MRRDVAALRWRMNIVVMRFALVAGLVLALTGPASADFEDGTAAYDRSDYATALREWLPLAEQGFSGAQVNIGLMYRKGQGVPQDYVKAREWFEKAADHGDGLAALNMAFMYRQGLGVPQDYAAAAGWYKKAALQGEVEAQYNVGLFYGSGTGVPRDLVQAYVWSSLAAVLYPPGRLRDDAVINRDAAAAELTPTQKPEAERLAAFRIGWAYHVGQGIDANGDEAIRQYCRAAELGLEEASFVLVLLGNGEGQLPEMTDLAWSTATAAARLPHGESQSPVMTIAATGSDPLVWAGNSLVAFDAILRALGLPAADVRSQYAERVCQRLAEGATSEKPAGSKTPSRRSKEN